jgi:hypothetical protein
MTMQILKTTAKLALPALIAVFALPAFGSTVTYTTTGTFSGCVGCVSAAPADSVTFDQHPERATVLTALSGPTTVITVPPTFSATGNAVTFVDSTTGGNLQPETASGTFTLTIQQGANSGSLTGTLSGTLENGCGAPPLPACVVARVTFADTSVTIAGVEYQLNSNVYLLPVNHTATSSAPGNGSDTITMTITNVTPEPTFMMLTGLGFACVAFVAYRRKRTA